MRWRGQPSTPSITRLWADCLGPYGAWSSWVATLRLAAQAVVSADCPTVHPMSSAAAPATYTRRVTPRPIRFTRPARLSSTSAPTTITSPAPAPSQTHRPANGLPSPATPTSSRHPTPPASARRPGTPWPTDSHAAITSTPLSTKVCRYGLPFGSAKACHARWVGPHCMDTSTATASTPHPTRTRTATARWNGSAKASTSTAELTYIAGELKP